MTPAGPEWNTDAFVRLLPGRSIKKVVKWVYDKLNFNQVLWMPVGTRTVERYMAGAIQREEEIT